MVGSVEGGAVLRKIVKTVAALAVEVLLTQLAWQVAVVGLVGCVAFWLWTWEIWPHRTEGAHDALKVTRSKSEPTSLAVQPDQIVLHSGEWATKNSVTISNRSDDDRFAVFVKIWTPTSGIRSENILIEASEHDSGAPILRVGNLRVRSDLFVLDCIDPDGHECALARIFRLPAHVSRTLIVSGTAVHGVRMSIAHIGILASQSVPDRLVESKDKIAIPFEAPQDFKTKGFRIETA